MSWNSNLAETLAKRGDRVRAVFQQRLARIGKVCKSQPAVNLTMRFPERLNRHWTVSPHRKLALCRMAKQGSTTWAAHFVRMYKQNFNGRRAQETSRKIEDKFLTPQEKLSVIESVKKPGHDYFAFFVCRDPVAKLVSTYKYNLARSKGRGGQEGGRARAIGFPAGQVPSWQNYLEMRATGALDSGTTHPIWRSCDVCNNHWDAVVHMETFDSDTQVILEASGLSHLGPAHLNNHGSAGSKGLTRAEVRRLFNKSSRQVVEYVEETYKKDFLLCGYLSTLAELRMILKEKK